MSEDDSNLNQPNQTEWQAPPLPEEIIKTDEPAQMSEAATLGNIFISPGETFTDLRRKPRFIFAIVIIMIMTTAYGLLFSNKIGEERMKSFALEQIDKSPQASALTPEQKQDQVRLQTKISGVVKYFIPILVLIGIAIGSLIYWLAGKAMGGDGNYWHAVSTWVYASFPPIVIAMFANILILFLKSADEIDIATSQSGLVHANPGFFIDGKSSPVLATLLGTFDFFVIWGWILAAIGLQKLMKLSSGSAWTIVLILALVGLAFKVIFSLISGNPM
jgi:Yip1 domain